MGYLLFSVDATFVWFRYWKGRLSFEGAISFSDESLADRCERRDRTCDWPSSQTVSTLFPVISVSVSVSVSVSLVINDDRSIYNLILISSSIIAIVVAVPVAVVVIVVCAHRRRNRAGSCGNSRNIRMTVCTKTVVTITSEHFRAS